MSVYTFRLINDYMYDSMSYGYDDLLTAYKSGIYVYSKFKTYYGIILYCDGQPVHSFDFNIIDKQCTEMGIARMQYKPKLYQVIQHQKAYTDWLYSTANTTFKSCEHDYTES